MVMKVERMSTTAQLTPKIVARLGQLILMLSSPHDGEKVAACGAIVRTLGSAGLDLHALAEIVTSAAAGEKPPIPPIDEPSPQDDAAWCLRVGAAMLTARERKFLEDIARARYTLSAKQQAWLDSIIERVEAVAR
jgi:hypothetical protein